MIDTGTSSEQRLENSFAINNHNEEAFAELERSVHAALETYSNVHRGSGLNSMVTTCLYEMAREIVLGHLKLDKAKFVVIFCTPRRADTLIKHLKHESFQIISSSDIGLSLGLRALVVEKKSLPAGPPFQTGGGTARLVSPSWVIWADAPAKFEAGTPAIVNAITFAKALQMTEHWGNGIFRTHASKNLTAHGILFQDNLDKYSGLKMFHELRQTLIGKNVNAPTTEGPKRFINLDNGASTPTFAPVWEAFSQTLKQPMDIQMKIIQEVRSVCAEALGAPIPGYDFIFTSNTTEAINLVAESLNYEPEQDTESVIVNTILEHNSNDLPWRNIPNNSLIRLKVDPEGFLDINELDALLRAYNLDGRHGKKRIRLVALSGASNVLGIFNNLEELSQTIHRYDARLLVDAAQLVAHRKVEMEKYGIDYLAFSGHKAYAPFGSGVLAVRKGLLNFGKPEMELIHSSGEENTAGIASLGKSLVLLQRIGFELIRKEEQALTSKLLNGLTQIKNLTVYGIKNPDSPRFGQKGGVIVFSVKNIMPDRLAGELSERGGIGVRYGCHCAHMLVKYLLKVPKMFEDFQRLIVILFPGLRLPGILRVSLGIGNSEEDVDDLIKMLGKITQKPVNKREGMPESPDAGTILLTKKELKQQISDFIKAAATEVYSLRGL